MPVSPPVTDETTFELLLAGRAYTLTLFRSAAEPAFESAFAESVFQTSAYHLALEEAPPADMAFYYVRIDGPERFGGLLSFQVKRFNPGESLRNQAERSIWNRIRYSVARLIDMEVLCLGNTLVTGDYGMLFAPAVPATDRVGLITATIDWLLTLRPFRRVSMLFVKDFYEDIFAPLPALSAGVRYHPIATQPNMILDVDPAWGSLDGYLDALKSKYRVRAKKALSLARGLERTELDLAQIIAQKDVLHGLYQQVAADVGFNLFTLSPDYMASLKRRLGDRFRLWVYKENGEVISFFTVIEDGEWLDAHFLGYDPGVNKRYHLYHHMLLTMIDLAARRGFRKLQLSRTATEIKSSVGAAGVPMWAYMRHTRPWVNVLFPHIYRFFQPDLSWVPRSPFTVERTDAGDRPDPGHPG